MVPRTQFQIRDLEEFSGVKAHTIRIWEKRYGLLEPARTDTNIRTYGINDLRTILNVAYLNRQGHKISRIASLDPAAREKLVNETALAEKSGEGTLTSLKMAMLGFDEVLFDNVEGKYREANGFDRVVEDLYLPLLEHIGVLWQTSAICPAHEHFISNIIRHKLIAAASAIPLRSVPRTTTYILFLPPDELHELSLLYVNLLLRRESHRTIYLGQSVPIEDLRQLSGTPIQHHIFITSLTSFPALPELERMINELATMLPADHNSIWLAGRRTAELDPAKLPKGVMVFHDLNGLKKLLAEGSAGG